MRHDPAGFCRAHSWAPVFASRAMIEPSRVVTKTRSRTPCGVCTLSREAGRLSALSGSETWKSLRLRATSMVGRVLVGAVVVGAVTAVAAGPTETCGGVVAVSERADGAGAVVVTDAAGEAFVPAVWPESQAVR